MLYSSGDLIGAQAPCAGVHPLCLASQDRLNALDIGLISAVRTPVGVGHKDAECHFFAAIFAFRH